MNKVVFICLFFCGLIVVSCAKDVEEELNPIDSCVTQDMSFQNDVLPIFNTNCNGCHGASANFGGITLDNYADTKKVVDAARLLGAINRDEGFSEMPQGASKLPDCSIDKVAAWIADGAPNN